MIHWNPEQKRTTSGIAYGIDDRGLFDFDDGSNRIDPQQIGLIEPLEDLSMIHLRSKRYHVLVSLTQQEYNVFSTDENGGSFSIHSSIAQKDFFRFGVQLETGKTSFADIPFILRSPHLQTDEMKRILTLVPDYQLTSLGIESLRQIIK